MPKLVGPHVVRKKARDYLMLNVQDLLNPSFWIEVIVEFVLCAFVSIIVIWAVVTLNPGFYQPSSHHFGLFGGFIMMVLIEGWGPLCGAIGNPCAAWGLLLAGRINVVRAFVYMAVDTAGAAAGAMIGVALTPEEKRTDIPTMKPGPGMTMGMGMAVEGILAFNFMVVVLVVTNPKTKTSIMPSFPIAFLIGGGIMAAGTHTGGLQNPLISFCLAVAKRNFELHFEVYWVGPIIGTTIGAIFYLAVVWGKVKFNRQKSLTTAETKNEAETDGVQNPYPAPAEDENPSYTMETFKINDGVYDTGVVRGNGKPSDAMAKI